MTKLGGWAIVSAIMGPGLNTHFAQLPRAGQLTMQTSDIGSMVTSHNEPHGHQSVNGGCLWSLGVWAAAKLVRNK